MGDPRSSPLAEDEFQGIEILFASTLFCHGRLQPAIVSLEVRYLCLSRQENNQQSLLT